jgi:hypothetical protein
MQFQRNVGADRNTLVSEGTVGLRNLQGEELGGDVKRGVKPEQARSSHPF